MSLLTHLPNQFAQVITQGWTVSIHLSNIFRYVTNYKGCSEWITVNTKSLLSCPTLCNALDSTHHALLSMGFSRQDYWSGLPCPPPGDLPIPGIEPTSLGSPAWAGGFFTTSTIWDALMLLCLRMVSSFLMIPDVPWYKSCYHWWFEATIDKYLMHFPLGAIINDAGKHNFAYSPKSEIYES